MNKLAQRIMFATVGLIVLCVGSTVVWLYTGAGEFGTYEDVPASHLLTLIDVGAVDKIQIKDEGRFEVLIVEKDDGAQLITMIEDDFFQWVSEAGLAADSLQDIDIEIIEGRFLSWVSGQYVNDLSTKTN